MPARVRGGRRAQSPAGGWIRLNAAATPHPDVSFPSLGHNTICFSHSVIDVSRHGPEFDMGVELFIKVKWLLLYLSRSAQI